MSWTEFLASFFILSGAGAAIPVPQTLESDVDADKPVAPDIVDTNTDAQNRMTVDVSIDGNGPYNFLIDTGSERTVLARQLADNLQLEFAERARLMGVAGSQIVDTVYVPDLALGQQNYGEVVAPLLERKNIGAEGILGLDGLQNQRILFDFKGNKIEIEDNQVSGINRGYEIVVYARRRNGQLIFTDATVGGVKIDVVIDTGAQMNIGNRALQKKLRSRRARGVGQISTLTSVTGQTIDADAGFVNNFRIGNARFSYIPVAFADSPTFETLGLDKKPALFLGMATLRNLKRMAIDFDKRRVYFDMPALEQPKSGTLIRRQ